MKVSVILPAFNEEKTIRKTIENVFNQSFKDIELLIINDGSTDDTQKIIDSMPDPRIRVKTNKENKGLTFSLNVGLRFARGEFVAVANCGDTWLESKLERQLLEFRKNSDLVLVGTKAHFINGKDTARACSDARFAMYFGDPFVHSSVLIRNLGGLYYDLDFVVSQDYDFFERLTRFGKASVINECLVFLRPQKDHPIDNTFKVLKRFYPKESKRLLGIILLREKPTVKEFFCLGWLFFRKAVRLKSFVFLRLAILRFGVILKGGVLFEV